MNGVSSVLQGSVADLTSASCVPGGPKGLVAVGISGGVDSAVAAKVLKDRGHDVVGVFMRNWDEAEETGNQNCSIEEDFKNAKHVCRTLSIPLLEADFITQYWDKVFQSFLNDLEKGYTPNPDLDCNKYIKFQAFVDFVRSKGIDTVATGHYARIGEYQGENSAHKLLLRGKDHDKDQTYFLSSIRHDILSSIMFPIGHWTKAKVRSFASEKGLPPATRKSSTGICFIGKRNFGQFISQYIRPIPGKYIDIDTKECIGECSDILTVTYGQRPGIGGSSERTYIVGKNIEEAIVYTASGINHGALYTKRAALGEINWLSPLHKSLFDAQGALPCQYKARYRQQARPCTLYALKSPEILEFQTSKLWNAATHDQTKHWISFDEYSFAITPRQALVLYDGDICIGFAPILLPGQTKFEM